ncbi:MAG: hypothetical protein L0I76_25690, partial [Pseudonocardia sp.]|nr:hypothetical protein [Pseudonocardia sp.]
MADDDRAERPTGSRATSGAADSTSAAEETSAAGTSGAAGAGSRSGPPWGPGTSSPEDLSEPKFSWQGAPGYTPFDPQRFPPHAPMPGAPPYPAGVEHEAPPISAGRRDAVIPRCLAAAGVWAVVALVLA